MGRARGRKTSPRPAALNCANPRAHWPKVSVAWGNCRCPNWALKGANNGGSPFPWNEWPSSRPVHLIPVHPTPHEAFGLCAVGLPQFKAAGLAVVFDHTTRPVWVVASFPTPHEAYGLCAVGLIQFKAAGLAVVFDHTAPTFYRVIRFQPPPVFHRFSPPPLDSRFFSSLYQLFDKKSLPLQVKS